MKRREFCPQTVLGLKTTTSKLAGKSISLWISDLTALTNMSQFLKINPSFYIYMYIRLLLFLWKTLTNTVTNFANRKKYGLNVTHKCSSSPPALLLREGRAPHKPLKPGCSFVYQTGCFPEQRGWPFLKSTAEALRSSCSKFKDLETAEASHVPTGPFIYKEGLRARRTFEGLKSF